MRRFGVDVVRFPPEPRLISRDSKPSATGHLQRGAIIRDQGVTVVLDAGANVGQWAATLWREGWHRRIISFEPLAEAFVELEYAAASDSAWECRRLALGDADGLATLNVAGNSISSSLRPMEERHLHGAPESAYVGSEIVTMSRLDSIVGELLTPIDRAYLKLDVQGYELQALEGARETLPRVAAIEVELSLVPLYREQALYFEIIAWLDRAGYGVASLEAGFADSTSGELLQIDAVFVRRAGKAI